jgi:hypothetical protein
VLSEDPRLNLLTNPGIVSDRRVEQRTPVHDTDSTGSAPPRSRPRGCILGTVASAATLAASSPSLPPSHATTSDRHCSCGHAAVTATAVMRRVPPHPGALPETRPSRLPARSRKSHRGAEQVLAAAVLIVAGTQPLRPAGGRPEHKTAKKPQA